MDAPPRGTRPRNRREVTLAAASELFRQRGYANVSMGDIAAATNVGASAIYRHFSSKSELLIASVEFGLGPYLETIRSAGPDVELPELFRLIAECALDHRSLGVLWQREARALDDEQRRPLRDQLVAISRLVSTRISAARPELDDAQADTLSWCVMGASVSIGFHSATLPREEFVTLLSGLFLSIVGVDFDDLPEQPPITVPDSQRIDSRRDTLITEATELFAERGFAGAGLGEIGDAAGIAGPSIYGHFPSKQDLLVAVVRRGTEALRVATDRVLDAHLPPLGTLLGLVDSYVTSINENRFAIRILISEMNELPPDEREESRRSQREYVDTWVGPLRELVDPDDASARIRAQAILRVVNDAVQTPHLRSQPGFEETINRVARAMLGIRVR